MGYRYYVRQCACYKRSGKPIGHTYTGDLRRFAKFTWYTFRQTPTERSVFIGYHGATTKRLVATSVSIKNYMEVTFISRCVCIINSVFKQSYFPKLKNKTVKSRYICRCFQKFSQNISNVTPIGNLWLRDVGHYGIENSIRLCKNENHVNIYCITNLYYFTIHWYYSSCHVCIYIPRQWYI